MPDAFCGPFSAHLQCRVYCSLTICGLIWQCLFISLQSPQYHPATNPQYRPESPPAPSLLSALATGMLLPPKITDHRPLPDSCDRLYLAGAI